MKVILIDVCLLVKPRSSLLSPMPSAEEDISAADRPWGARLPFLRARQLTRWAVDALLSG